MKQALSSPKSGIPDTQLTPHKLPSALGNFAIASYVNSLPALHSKAASSPEVLQRQILFSEKSQKVPPCATNEELIELLTNYYGEEHRSLITRLVEECSASTEAFSLDDVHHYIARNVNAQPYLGYGRTPQAAYNQLSFSTTTRASLTSSALPDPLSTRNSKRLHAERVLLDKLKSFNDIHGESFTMTINNSPCLACAKILAKWVKQTGNHLTVRFCNCYGSEKDFADSMQILREAGIELHTFDLLELHPDWITKTYRKRMDGMQKRQKRLKQVAEFDSDSESGVEIEIDSEIEHASPLEHSLYPRTNDFIRDFWRQETQSDIYIANGIEYTAVNLNVRQDGACFWDSLRRHAIGEDFIQKAAEITGLTVDSHIYIDDVFRFVEVLSCVMDQPIRLEIAEFHYGNTTVQSVKKETYGEGVLITIHLAFFHMPDEGDGHFVPPMRY